MSAQETLFPTFWHKDEHSGRCTAIVALPAIGPTAGARAVAGGGVVAII